MNPSPTIDWSNPEEMFVVFRMEGCICMAEKRLLKIKKPFKYGQLKVGYERRDNATDLNLSLKIGGEKARFNLNIGAESKFKICGLLGNPPTVDRPDWIAVTNLDAAMLGFKGVKQLRRFVINACKQYYNALIRLSEAETRVDK